MNMLRFYTLIIIKFAFIILSANAKAVKFKVNEYGLIEGKTACVKLVSISMNEKGYVSWNFKRYGDNACAKSTIDFVKSTPRNNIRGTKGIKDDNTFINTFNILTTPDTTSLKILTNNYYKISGWALFQAKNKIPELLELSQLGDWKKNFTNSESLLKEKKNKDKSPPKIRVSSPNFNNKNQLIVDTYSSFIRGKVSDENGVLNLLIKGQKVRVKDDGSFATKVKLAFGKNEITIKAEDINNNISQKKLIIVRKEFVSEQNLIDVDFPPKTKMRNPDALAVVIGIENYQYVPDATFAYNDAEVFREYLSQTLGFKKQRIKIVTNSKATQAEISKLLGANGWLSRNIVNGKSDVVVYFSGHGIANPKNQSTGLLPFDVDPNYSVGLSLKNLYKNLSSLEAKSVTVFLDACFTGQTRDSKMLIADARPMIIPLQEIQVSQNINIFSAASGSQISGALKDKEHGLFTYYLLKGMSGSADIDNDKKISLSELSQFVKRNVKRQAAIDGREQVPSLNSNNNLTLIDFD